MSKMVCLLFHWMTEFCVNLQNPRIKTNYGLGLGIDKSILHTGIVGSKNINTNTAL